MLPLLVFLLAAGADPAPSGEPGLTRMPVLLHNVEAAYPEAARREGREGSVVLALDVDEFGEVQRIEVLESAGVDFDVAAMEAAAQFLFSPAEAGELGPVPVRIVYRSGFVLKAPATSTATVASTSSSTAAEPRARRMAPINFLGTVREAGTRAPIAFATVEVEPVDTATRSDPGVRTSTETDARGRFAFRGLPRGRHRVRVSAAEFSSFDNVEDLREDESIEVLYYLDRSERSPYEIVVRTRVERKEVARRTLRFEEIERLPGTQGDAIRVIQNLPGVARPPFGVGLLVVRGAPPQDTGVFLDGQRLPILFHFGGIGGVTSVVNARMLEAIDFMPGGFGPELGRVSAGAVELRSRLAATDRVHGEAVVDLAGASIFLEGPVTERPEDGAFVLALRRSYIDGILAGVLSLTKSSVAFGPRYYDYQARYDRPLSSNLALSILAYGSDDELVFLGSPSSSGISAGTETRTYFHRVNPRLTYTSGEDVASVSPIFGLDYSNLQAVGENAAGQVRLLLRDVNFGLRLDGTKRAFPWLKLAGGGDFLFFLFNSDSEVPAFPRTKDFPSPVGADAATRKDRSRVPAYLASAYAEAALTPLPGLSLWPGVRFDLYHFSADAAPLIDPRLVEGRTLLGLDPRLSARYQLFDRLALKGQLGIFRQPPLPPQLYLNADLPLQRARQASFGVELGLVDRLALDIQAYGRFVDWQPRASSRTEVSEEGVVRPVGFDSDGQLRSRGVELLLKLEKRWHLFGWIAYTLSRSEYRRLEGVWRPNFFADQTHNLNMVASYELGLSWFLSARFRYVTGGGLAQTSARWYDADLDGYDRTQTVEQRRAPAFHQLDLRVDKRWTFDEWYLEVYLDVQNVYNRRNTEFYAPTFDFKREVAIPSLPFLPVFGVKGVF